MRSNRFPAPTFVTVNLIAVAGHFASAAAMIYFMTQYDQLNFPLTENYLQWKRADNSTCPIGRTVDTRDNGEFCIDPTLDSAGLEINLPLLIVMFHLLSFFFQLLADLTHRIDFVKTLVGYDYWNIGKTGQNPLRFIEYSISASIMLVAIALLNGITDINLLTCIIFLTGTCQLVGLAVELIEDASVQWLLHVSGWLQFVCAYGVIIRAFVKAATADEDIQPPDFVWVIVIALALLYSVFGFVQLTELCCKLSCSQSFCGSCPVSCRKNNKINNECKEISYVVLSLSAKLLLGWMLFSNLFMV